MFGDDVIYGSILALLLSVAVLIGGVGIVFLFINEARRSQGTKMIIGATIAFVVLIMMAWNTFGSS
jgi:hypothetical protein